LGLVRFLRFRPRTKFRLLQADWEAKLKSLPRSARVRKRAHWRIGTAQICQHDTISGVALTLMCYHYDISGDTVIRLQIEHSGAMAEQKEAAWLDLK